MCMMNFRYEEFHGCVEDGFGAVSSHAHGRARALGAALGYCGCIRGHLGADFWVLGAHSRAFRGRLVGIVVVDARRPTPPRDLKRTSALTGFYPFGMGSPMSAFVRWVVGASNARPHPKTCPGWT